MGAFLDKPKTEKLTASGAGEGLRYGVSAMQGWRMEMEDAHTCEINQPFDDKNTSSFFGVFDGHAGPKAAKYCSNKLLVSITECYKNDTADKLKEAIHTGFIKLDDKMKEEWSEGTDRSGTTAVVTVVTPEQIYLGNCGDSRGILCRSGKVEFATADHKPYNPIEKKRIEMAGGTVMMQRVNGSLAVSRALGDFDYKRAEDFPSIKQLVSPEPDITVLNRDQAEDQFLLLACDGIFDVMTNDEVVSYVHRQLPLHKDLTVICSSLIDLCLNKNSRDNMSVVLVTFPGAPKVSEKAIEENERKTKECLSVVEVELNTLVEEAKDPLDLEEGQIMVLLTTDKHEAEFREFVVAKKEMVLDMLAEKRKQKFKDNDFPVSSDSSEPLGFGYMAPPENFDDQVPLQPLEPTGQLVQPSEADSDTTTKENTNSTTNKTIM